jgi:adenosylcobalamin-dependent ribonucleoside-triphosphate reductase
MHEAVPFGPTGEVVYNRTYSRVREDGTKETWPDTVKRVAEGNLALVYGPQSEWKTETFTEYDRLSYYMNNFALIPAGRHLWATGVAGRQHLFNCHVAGWDKDLSAHFEFSFLRLMEGGGVGSNYSMKHVAKYGVPRRNINVHIVCDPAHPDYQEIRPSLSQLYEPSTGWAYDENEPYIHLYSPGDGILVDDSREGWADALVHLVSVYMSDDDYWPHGTDLVFDVSRVRASGSRLMTFGGTASGPAPFARMMHEVSCILNCSYERDELTGIDLMEIDHAIAECVVSGGNRRSARMSIMKWNDPYIFSFLECKANTGLHWTTNISVEIDDEFLSQVNEFGSHADIVHKAVVHGMLANGEPGYWNSSLSQIGETGEVIATNPCGEIALESWENCNLGHVNLDWFADKGYGPLEEAHRLMTRFLMRATFGDVNDPRQADRLARNRRIGVGHLGVQGFWAKRGKKYSEIPQAARGLLNSLYQTVRQEAQSYAHTLRISVPVKLTCMAPTGSVAKLPGATESGQAIHSKWFEQRIRFSKRDESQFAMILEAMNKGFKVEDDIYDKSGMTAVVVYPTENILLSQVRSLGFSEDIVQSQDELTVEDMLRVQRVYQTCWADNAVSYTVNIREGSVTEEELAEILARYLPNLKGTTVMVDASRPQAPYTRITREEYEAAVVTAISDSVNEECASGACPVR